jgi:hypothetical protein
MYHVDITADLNDEDETGYVWTFLDEARDPGQINPGALVVAGDEEAAAVCQGVDLVPAGDGTIVPSQAPSRPGRRLPRPSRAGTRQLTRLVAILRSGIPPRCRPQSGDSVEPTRCRWQRNS